MQQKVGLFFIVLTSKQGSVLGLWASALSTLPANGSLYCTSIEGPKPYTRHATHLPIIKQHHQSVVVGPQHNPMLCPYEWIVFFSFVDDREAVIEMVQPLKEEEEEGGDGVD